MDEAGGVEPWTVAVVMVARWWNEVKEFESIYADSNSINYSINANVIIKALNLSTFGVHTSLCGIIMMFLFGFVFKMDWQKASTQRTDMGTSER